MANVAAVFILIVLALLTLPVLSGDVTFVLVLTAGLGLIALPTTVAIGFVGRYRCLDCSYRFASPR